MTHSAREEILAQMTHAVESLLGRMTHSAARLKYVPYDALCIRVTHGSVDSLCIRVIGGSDDSLCIRVIKSGRSVPRSLQIECLSVLPASQESFATVGSRATEKIITPLESRLWSLFLASEI